GAHDLTGEGVRDGWRAGSDNGRRRWRRGGGAHYLDGGLAFPRARPGFDDCHTSAHAGHCPIVVHPRYRHVVRRPDDAHGGDHISDAVERGGEQPAPLPDLDCDRGGGYLDFSDVLCRHRPGIEEDGEEEAAPCRHSGAKVSARKCRCQANLSRNTRHRSSRGDLTRIHLRGSIPGVSYRPRPPTPSEERSSDARVNGFFGEQLDWLGDDGADVPAGTLNAAGACADAG